MQVFKYYFVIARTLRRTILIYVIIFGLGTASMIAQLQQSGGGDFTATKPKIAIVDHDNTVLTRGLEQYLRDRTTVVDIADNAKAQKDALYYQTADAIYTIPPQFTADFMAHKTPQLAIQTGSSASGEQAKAMSATYLRLATVRAQSGMNEQQVVDGTLLDIAHTATIKTSASAVSNTEGAQVQYFYNFMAYPILGLNIVVISLIMLSFNSRMIKRRNSVSALPAASLSRQLALGNAVFSVALAGVLCVVAHIMYPSYMQTINGQLYDINVFVFSAVGLALGFLLGQVLKNRRSVSAISNVVVLGMCFISGVFVSQNALSQSVIDASKALPAYWYVNANDQISRLLTLEWKSFGPLAINWMIIIGFAAIIGTAAFLAARRRRA